MYVCLNKYTYIYINIYIYIYGHNTVRGDVTNVHGDLSLFEPEEFWSPYALKSLTVCIVFWFSTSAIVLLAGESHECSVFSAL